MNDTGVLVKNTHRLKAGNSKLWRVMVFDLPAGEKGSCLETCDYCYALKAERAWPNVRKWRRDNFILAKHYPKVLEEMISRQLEDLTPSYTVVRIHSSGDFFSQEYLDMWINIVESFPDLNFYAYTKRLDDFDWSNVPGNLNIINSYIEIDGRRYINYGNEEYIENLKRLDPGIFVCPADGGRGDIMCNKNCKYCIQGGKVVFHKH